MGSIFKFKEFEVNQQGCAMKINTDGVLLAAIADQIQPGRILDIGTGTGVIAMMMAQRFPDALIDAVEIDEAATLRATQNFAASAFAHRLNAVHTPIEDFTSSGKYDLIVSNPPFFVNDLKNTEGRKSLARHTDERFFESLLERSNELLTREGVLWLILPVKQANFVIDKASDHKLLVHREIRICSDISKPVIRMIICLSRNSAVFAPETFYIYEAEGRYTQAYKQLLKDFFLAF